MPTAVRGMRPLALEANHMNGSTLRVGGIRLDDEATLLQVLVINGFREPIRLSAGQDFVLRDDLGNTYALAALGENRELIVAPGATLQSVFRFEGRMATGARRARLITNERSGDDGGVHSTHPRFELEIPLR